ENKNTLNARAQKIDTAHADALDVECQREQIKNDAAPHDELREAEIASEAVQQRGESPHAGIPAAAGKTLIVVDANQVAARWADDRSPLLSQHFLIMKWRKRLCESGMEILA